MRVIAGSARSLLLVVPKGDGTRPTTDRIKETLFNVMQNAIPDAIFADVFAGSGAIGIEAMSRGAKKCYFIENNKEALKCIDENVKHTHFAEKSDIISADAISAIRCGRIKDVDVLFADPPYGKGYDRMLLEAIMASNVLADDALIVIEESKDTDFSYASGIGFDIIKEKIYKNNKHVFLEISKDMN